MFSKAVIVCLLFLGTVNWTWAEGSEHSLAAAESFSSDTDDAENDEKQSNFHQIPFFPDFGSLFSGGSGLPSFPGLGGLNFPGFGGFGGSRTKRSIEAEESETNDSELQSRFFFKFPTSFVNCNATTQSGPTCVGCNQALTCNSNNIGVLRRCHGLFRHCNGGRCSLVQSSACATGGAETTVAATTVTDAGITNTNAVTTADTATPTIG